MNLKARLFPLASLLFLAAAGSALADSTPYSVQKTALFIQTSNNTAVASARYPYDFEAQATNTATLILPGASTQVIPFNAGGGDYDLISAFTSKSGVDTAYPDGTYQMTGTGIPTISMALTPDSYPSTVPAVTNATFSNGVFYVDPASNVTLNLSTFSDYNTVGVVSHEGLQIQDQTNGGTSIHDDILSKANPFGLTVSTTPFTSYTISSGSLTSGHIYELDLSYETGLTFDTTSVPGNGVVAIFANHTVAYFVALASSSAPPPVIASDLTNQSGLVGGSATLSANVTVGGAPITGSYTSLWYANGQAVNIDGVKYVNSGTTLTINTLTTADAGTYFVKFITQGGLIVSANATVTVLPAGAGTPPTINSTTGATGAVSAGTAVNLSVSASESGLTLTYQWQLGGVNISGATSNAYAIASAGVSNVGDYTVVVSNGYTTSSHDFGTLTIAGVGAPSFTVNPVAVTIATGRSAAFSVAATGLPTPTYQWNLNGAPIAGATDPILEVQNASSASAGIYTCTATNAVSAATSTGATLTVSTTSNPGHLINLSTRANVGTGNNILIGGFAVGGTGTKSLLVRGVGPALTAPLGGSGELATPQLTLLNSAVIASDIGWGNALVLGPTAASDSPQLATGTFMDSLGAAMYAAASADTAMVVTAPVGNSTAEVSGVGGTTGIALVEFYDADTAPAPTAHLINISARADVGTGNNILIGGFVISGAASETVLIRAVGPGLVDSDPTDFSLATVLNQPVLTLLNSSGVAIYSNTVWGGDATLASIFGTVGAFGLNSAHADSVLLVTLPAGNYTAEVSGLNGGTGIALCEIYEVQ